jgi:hypothetical protein
MSLAHFRWPASLGKRFVGQLTQALTTTKAPPIVVADGESSPTRQIGTTRGTCGTSQIVPLHWIGNAPWCAGANLSVARLSPASDGGSPTMAQIKFAHRQHF